MRMGSSRNSFGFLWGAIATGFWALGICAHRKPGWKTVETVIRNCVFPMVFGCHTPARSGPNATRTAAFAVLVLLIDTAYFEV